MAAAGLDSAGLRKLDEAHAAIVPASETTPLLGSPLGGGPASSRPAKVTRRGSQQWGDVRSSAGLPRSPRAGGSGHLDHEATIEQAMNANTEERKSVKDKFYAAVRAVQRSSWAVNTLSNDVQEKLYEDHYDEVIPSSKALILQQVVLSGGCIGYTLSAWIYCCIARQTLFIRCFELYPYDLHHSFYRIGCEVSQVCFWTYPLVCCIASCIFFFFDVLHTRVWYELFGHNIIMGFQNSNCFKTIQVQIVLVWGFASLLMLPFTQRMTLHSFQMSLPYWFPIMSFMITMYSMWDIELRLMSVCKYAEKDPEWAKEHHNQCIYLNDFILREAFLHVHQEIKRERRCTPRAPTYIKSVKSFTTAGFVDAMRQEAERLGDEGASTQEDCQASAGFQDFAYHHWMYIFLFTEKLEDRRAVRFRWWFRFYVLFSLTVLVLLLYLLFTTLMTNLRQQRIIGEHWLIGWFSVDNFVASVI